MRLLDTLTLELKYFVDDKIPKYAILSHTWTDEEVSIQDIAANTHHSKTGWRKIQGCCKQALKDGHLYVWVDTCCIDKTSSAELSEAINSMSQWYKSSQVCYAYLEDVHDRFDLDDPEGPFTRSRYFTRGWTLQELIAPKQVIFYNAAWKYLKSRNFLADKIAKFTGIDADLLRGATYLSNCSVARRFSWAAHRQTTRVEDQAYSLLGLFDVNMPLLYGEGAKAFMRLQEEILRTTWDLSTLAWAGYLSVRAGMPLASSVRDFASCAGVIKDVDVTGLYQAVDTAVTPIGFRMNVPLVDLSETYPDAGLAAILNCHYLHDITTVIALKLNASSLSRTETMAQTGGTLSCTIGWPGDSQQDRLILVDVLHAREHAQTKNVLVGRYQPFSGSTSVLPGQLWFTYLWLRFADHALSKRWNTQALYPKQYWTRGIRTFDLITASRDKVAQYSIEGSRPPAWPSSNFGLPIDGAIALSDPAGNRVAIYFRLHSWNTKSNLDFVVEYYEPHKFEAMDKIYPLQPDGNDNKARCLQLLDGSTFQVTLRLEKISRQSVVLLAVSVEPVLPTS